MRNCLVRLLFYSILFYDNINLFTYALSDFYPIISYHIMSYLTISYPILSCSILLNPIPSYPISASIYLSISLTLCLSLTLSLSLYSSMYLPISLFKYHDQIFSNCNYHIFNLNIDLCKLRLPRFQFCVSSTEKNYIGTYVRNNRHKMN